MDGIIFEQKLAKTTKNGFLCRQRRQELTLTFVSFVSFCSKFFWEEMGTVYWRDQLSSVSTKRNRRSVATKSEGEIGPGSLLFLGQRRFEKGAVALFITG